MSKSGNGDILGLDPAAVDAALGLAPSDQFIPSGAGSAGATTIPTAGADGMQYGLTVLPADGGVGMAGPDEILPPPDQMQPAPAISPIEQFYGSSDRITQPDAGAVK